LNVTLEPAVPPFDVWQVKVAELVGTGVGPAGIVTSFDGQYAIAPGTFSVTGP
jgi:hypothetical protein